MIFCDNFRLRVVLLSEAPETDRKGVKNMTEKELENDVERYRAMLFRLAYSTTGDLSVCDDIVWEVFMKLYSHKGSFDSENGKKAWLIRLTVNHSHNHTKSRWLRKRTEISETEYSHEIISDDIIALREALKTLKKGYREVIFLHYFEGYTAAEIGEILKISQSAVTTRLQRGRRMLKRFLEE